MQGSGSLAAGGAAGALQREAFQAFGAATATLFNH